VNVWFFYPMSKCVRFMEATNFRLFGHVLRIGPFALMVVWRRKATQEAAK
jgi:hypothetical protein